MHYKLFVAFILIVILLFMLSCKKQPPIIIADNPSNAMQKSTELKKPTMNQNLDWINAGTYEVGKDFSPGEYYIEVVDPAYNSYFSVFIKEKNDKLKKTREAQISNFGFLRLEKDEQLFVENLRLIKTDAIESIQKIDGYYTEGIYRIGVDIPNGIYYFEKSKDVNGGIVQIFDDYEIPDLASGETINNNLNEASIKTFAYKIVEGGKYLSVQGAKFIPFEEAPKPISNNGIYGEGMYLIGRDIPEGKYKITPNKDTTEADGYYAIYRDASWSANQIIKNRHFRFRTTLNVKEGQFLYISEATFEEK